MVSRTMYVPRPAGSTGQKLGPCHRSGPTQALSFRFPSKLGTYSTWAKVWTLATLIPRAAERLLRASTFLQISAKEIAIQTEEGESPAPRFQTGARTRVLSVLPSAGRFDRGNTTKERGSAQEERTSGQSFAFAHKASVLSLSRTQRLADRPRGTSRLGATTQSGGKWQGLGDMAWDDLLGL